MPRPTTMFYPLTAAALCLAAFPVPDDATEVDADDVPAARFTQPMRLMAGGSHVMVENPGYAAPARFDVNQDGHMDLVVGQFAGGKMHVFHGDAQGNLTPAGWLQAGGEAAEVPGVW